MIRPLERGTNIYNFLKGFGKGCPTMKFKIRQSVEKTEQREPEVEVWLEQRTTSGDMCVMAQGEWIFPVIILRKDGTFSRPAMGCTVPFKHDEGGCIIESP